MSAWDELKREVAIELEQLEGLLASHRSLLEKCRTASPDAVERSALAAVLHAFYTGVENVFVRIAVRVDGAKPESGAWHQELLTSIATASPSREAVLSADTVKRLSEYLAFRHVFRHSYTFQLRWEKMRHLVLGLDEMLERLREEIAAFLKRLTE